MTSQHKTIEQCAEECRDQDGACYVSYLAGAEKQKKLSDEREAIMLDIIGKLMGAQAISTGAIMVLQPGGIVNKALDETIASVEKKLKELKGE